MLCPCRSATLSFGNLSFEVDNGGLEGRFLGARDGDLRRFFQKVRGLAEGALPQPDRRAPENRRRAVQTHWRQSSFSRDGACVRPAFVFSFLLFGSREKFKWNYSFSATKPKN